MWGEGRWYTQTFTVSPLVGRRVANHSAVFNDLSAKVEDWREGEVTLVGTQRREYFSGSSAGTAKESAAASRTGPAYGTVCA